MANPPPRFVSVNLNKSYGQHPSRSSPNYTNGGIAPRARPAGSGGRGMVVLSRSRGGSGPPGQKAGSKLSVPAPLNLPSLRKEHERFDPSAAGSGPGAAGSSLSPGHGPSMMGWSKPAEGARDRHGSGEPPLASPAYVPPGSSPRPAPIEPTERAVLLRGEDFPTLKATTFLFNQKQKDVAVGQKQRSEVHVERPSSEPALVMRPHGRSIGSTDLKDPEVGALVPVRGSTAGGERTQKMDGLFSGPLPIIQFKHTSDWADDERDTGNGILDRGRDCEFPRVESGRGYDYLDGRTSRDFDVRNTPEKDCGRDVHTSTKNANSWRSQQHSREGYGGGLNRDGLAPRFLNHNRDGNRDKFGNSMYADIAVDVSRSGHADQQPNWRASGQGQISNSMRMADVYNGRRLEQNENGWHFDASSSRYRGDNSQKITTSKLSSSRCALLDDPILNMGKDNHILSNNGKTSLEISAFESRDPFSGGLSGDVNSKLLRRKKDLSRQEELHDPVRESFEAELERVQKLQEEERQRTLQEHARALELARKEEEERERMIRDKEEQKRRLEEEAREAAWRENQERLSAVRRAEEQRLAREEERKRMVMEEERRKEAAHQKLLELEAKIAKRQAEVSMRDNRLALPSADHQVTVANEHANRKVTDVEYWDDGAQMVEHVTSSTSSELTIINKTTLSGSSLSVSLDGNLPNVERRNLGKSWKNEVLDAQSTSFYLKQENDPLIVKQDALGSRRVLERKVYSSGQGASHLKALSKGDSPGFTLAVRDYNLSKGRSCNTSGEAEHYNRSTFGNHELHDSDQYEAGWNQDHQEGNPNILYEENAFSTSDAEGFSSAGRSRHSLRQPRVFPPPTFTYVNRGFLGDSPKQLNPTLSDIKSSNQVAEKSEDDQAYDSEDHDQDQHTNISFSHETVSLVKNNNDESASTSGTQSSVSVSNPPASPTHLSHDDFDDSGELPSLPASADGKPISFLENELVVPEVGQASLLLASRSPPSREDEEWLSENNAELQDQEEYDDGGDYDDYQDNREPNDGIDRILDVGEESFVLSSDMKNVSGEMEQKPKVLGFNDGVEVPIPCDDFEGSSLSYDNNINVQMVCEDVASRLNSSDGAIGNENDPHVEMPFHMEIKGTSKLTNDTENVVRGLVLENVESTHHAASSSEMSSSGVASVQTSTMSTFDLLKPSTSGLPAPLPISTVQGQAEAPLQLQFGLFSGPSFIPSPVPAIQIGSIQMPLNIHSPIGPSHVHTSQPPFFRFGHVRYTSAISQGIMPVGPPSVPYVQPSVPVHYSLTQKPVSSFNDHASLDSSALIIQKENMPAPVLPRSKPSYREKYSDESCSKSAFNQQKSLNSNGHKVIQSSHNHFECSTNKEKKNISGFNTAVKSQENHENAFEINSNLMHSKGQRQVGTYVEGKSSRFVSGERSLARSRMPVSSSAGRGKRYIYTIKNKGPQAQVSGLDIPRAELNFDRRARRNVRRTEFRVRENGHKRCDVSDASSHVRQEEKPYSNGNVSGPSSRNGSRKGDPPFNKSSKMPVAIESSNTGSKGIHSINFDGRKRDGKESTMNKSVAMMLSRPEEGCLNGCENIEEDVDAPLQSGVVRVYKQPGIEIPSDEDDFIEVRSKRQMLNDRREQREKEIKAKSRDTKVPRKQRAIFRTGNVSSKPTKVAFHGDMPKCFPTTSSMELPDLHNGGQAGVFSANTVSQPLAPIGTPSANADIDILSPHKKSSEMSHTSAISSEAPEEPMSLSIFEKAGPFENVTTSLGSWTNVHVNQQVMSLTQTQLEDAMKPECFDTCRALTVEHVNVGKEHDKMPISAVAQEKFSATGSPLCSLLAGERIQFGAVTTPTYLPSVSRTVTNGICPIPSTACKTETSLEHISASNNTQGIFFQKEKTHDSRTKDSEAEAEAEAAASAVAVAAIGSDGVANNGLSTTAVSDHEKFSVVDGCGITSEGGRRSSQLSSLSTGEESLPVTLPVDLSVEPPVTFWPAPQNTSSTMFSQFPGPPPSHFPCFDMNPMLRAPIFAFGTQDESNATQSQPQRSTTLGPGPLGAWSHSGMDSFYGPPGGFAGHFISPPGMPGVQSPHQMLFYNHFPTLAPYGVGIMGTTLISSGKQPDWKHNPASSTMGINAGDNENATVCSSQHVPPSMPPSLQHLTPTSPILPVGSALPMFDMSSLQSTVDFPVQARWSPLPATSLHSMPFPPLPRNQVDGDMPVDASQRTANLSSGNHKYPELRSTTEAETKFTFSSDPNTDFPNELGLVDPPHSVSAHVSSSGPSYNIGNNSDERGSNGTKPCSKSAGGNSSETVCVAACSNSGSGSSSTPGAFSATKSQITQPQNTLMHQQHHPVGYADKRGVSSAQKIGPGGEWHRRIGFQGRSHPALGPERGFPPSKMKQIYVAKSTSSRATTRG